MKKILLLVLVAGSLFASTERVKSLGGNAGFWGDDYSSMSVYPANVNNHNVAWFDNVTSTTGEGDAAVTTSTNAFTAVWGDGMKFGFGASSEENEVLNMWWGTGNMGANFGVNWADDFAFNTSFGYNMSGVGNIGVHFDYGTMMNFGLNFGRAQNIWIWDNMSVAFHMNDIGGDDNHMMADLNFWKINNWGSTKGLFGATFSFDNMEDVDSAGSPYENDTSLWLKWTFGAETMLNDWATFRVGYDQKFDFMNQKGSGANASMGLGFNYGGFMLDMTLLSYNDMMTNPVQYITGFNENALGSGFSISYMW